MTINYILGIPDAPNDPSVDQPDMKTNNDAIPQLIDIDHIGFNDTTFPNGYHDVIHQPPQVADPAAVPGIGQTYVKTVSGDQQLFFESGAGVISNLTGSGQTIIRGTVNIQAAPTFTKLLTLPADCVGFLVIQEQNVLINFNTVIPFFTDAGTGYSQQTISLIGSFTQLVTQYDAPGNPLDLQIARAAGSGSDYTAIYKIIYWKG